MSDISALEAKVKALEAKVKALEKSVEPVSVKEDATIVLCTWADAPDSGRQKCAWTGRIDKYQAHLIAQHGGKDYVRPKTGIPVKEA